MYRNDGQAGTEAGGRLYLVLDKLLHPGAEKNSGEMETIKNAKTSIIPHDNDEERDEAGGPDLGQASPPVVLRWKVEQGDGWRAWDPDVDGTASDLKRDVPVWKMLRGQFVDSDKLFSVPIRSGLDWRRKGYLSCAAMG
jgi:hypothetical protein